MKFHDNLNPKLWNEFELKEEVKNKLEEITEAFIEFLDIPEESIIDVRITGSSANYNYTPYSDLDLHLIVDYEKVHKDCPIVEGYLWSMKSQFNKEHDISIYGIPVEVYAEDSTQEAISNGVYSLLNDEWIKKPEKIEPTTNDSAVESKYKEIKEAAERINDSEEAELLLSKIYEMRKAGLANGGEFSTENLAFKMLRNDNIIERLKEMKKEKIDKQLTLEKYNELQESTTHYFVVDAYDFGEGPFLSKEKAQEFINKYAKRMGKDPSIYDIVTDDEFDRIDESQLTLQKLNKQLQEFVEYEQLNFKLITESVHDDEIEYVFNVSYTDTQADVWGEGFNHDTLTITKYGKNDYSWYSDSLDDGGEEKSIAACKKAYKNYLREGGFKNIKITNVEKPKKMDPTKVNNWYHQAIDTATKEQKRDDEYYIQSALSTFPELKEDRLRYFLQQERWKYDYPINPHLSAVYYALEEVNRLQETHQLTKREENIMNIKKLNEELDRILNEDNGKLITNALNYIFKYNMDKDFFTVEELVKKDKTKAINKNNINNVIKLAKSLGYPVVKYKEQIYIGNKSYYDKEDLISDIKYLN